MNLKCQYTGKDGCDTQASWVMLTGCAEQHVEETILCTKHLNYWKDCANHKRSSLLLCDCQSEVIEYDYTALSRTSKEWLEDYIRDLMQDELLNSQPLSGIVAPHPAVPPSIGGAQWNQWNQWSKHKNQQIKPPGF